VTFENTPGAESAPQGTDRLVLIKLSQDWGATAWMPRDLRDWSQFITPPELGRALAGHGLQLHDLAGIAPSLSPPALFLLLRRLKKGVMSYGDFGRAAAFTLTKSLRISYIGHATKTRAADSAEHDLCSAASAGRWRPCLRLIRCARNAGKWGEMLRRLVLVTGAAGRVAAQLLPSLDDAYDLRLMDRAGDDAADTDPRLVLGDLTDHDVLDHVLQGVAAVVHLAGNPDPAAPWGRLRDPNVEGFATLLDAALGAGVRRVVFASSVHAMGVYEGTGRWPVDPAWPPAPCCAYGATKAFDEALARVYAYRSQVSTIGLRMGLCTPQASPAEAVAGWLRPADLQRIVIGALETAVPFGVYHALSWPSRRRWNIESAVRDLAYEPLRDEADASGSPDRAEAEGHLSTCAGAGHTPDADGTRPASSASGAGSGNRS
jgi:NAD+ dependent glucose-6-phosphate dehydrogenase